MGQNSIDAKFEIKIQRGREIREIFARASKLDESKKDKYSSQEWDQMKVRDGAKRFKRKIMGICGTSTVKSLDEVAQTLHELGAVSSIGEGRQIMSPIMRDGLIYYECYRCFEFSPRKSSEDQEVYRIEYINWLAWNAPERP